MARAQFHVIGSRVVDSEVSMVGLDVVLIRTSLHLFNSFLRICVCLAFT